MAASGIYDEYHRRLNLNNSGHSRSIEVKSGQGSWIITSNSICVCSLCSNVYQFQQEHLKLALGGFSLDVTNPFSDWVIYFNRWCYMKTLLSWLILTFSYIFNAKYFLSNLTSQIVLKHPFPMVLIWWRSERLILRSFGSVFSCIWSKKCISGYDSVPLSVIHRVGNSPWWKGWIGSIPRVWHIPIS